MTRDVLCFFFYCSYKICVAEHDDMILSLYVAFDCFIVVFSLVSMVLCIRSIRRAQQLKRVGGATDVSKKAILCTLLCVFVS